MRHKSWLEILKVTSLGMSAGGRLNIKMGFREIVLERVCWIQLAHVGADGELL
jgi:hypothetical protein